MSATVAAALKKIAVAILTDKKARKVVLGIILGILIILVMPLAAIIAIFNGDINIDANRLQTLVVQNMLINAQLRSKQEEIQPVRCDIACIVELSNAEFYDFQFNPLADHDFIKAHLPDLKTDEFHAIPCMLVLGEGVDDGILVDPQGYDYARYTAYIPMARQLFQNEQIESENEAPEEDDLEEEPFQGMTM